MDLRAGIRPANDLVFCINCWSFCGSDSTPGAAAAETSAAVHDDSRLSTDAMAGNVKGYQANDSMTCSGAHREMQLGIRPVQ